MQARLTPLLTRFSGLSLREQLLVLLAVFAVAYQFANLVVLDRQFQTIEALHQDIATDHAAINRSNAELTLLTSKAQQDPNRALRDEVVAARARVADLQARLASAASGMISPQDMARFLEQLLVQEDELTMLSLQTLDAEPLVSPTAGEAAQPPGTPVLHRHGFEIAFSGGYLPTLRYLRALEALPWQFFWDSVSYQVIDYPRSVIRLQLHTLSLSEDWIGV